MVLPSSYERYSGEVADPTDHAAEIAEATQLLTGFVIDMEANGVPASTPSQLQMGSDVLWLYAGCPERDGYMSLFLSMPEAAASYRATASLIADFVARMGSLISARLVRSAELNQLAYPLSSGDAAQVAAYDNQIPF